MTGTNHTLGGVLIASMVGNPVVAIPLAFGSHFVQDALPHFGEEVGKRKKLSKAVWVIDGTIVVCLMLYLLATQQWLFFAAGLAAMSPDFEWIYRLVVQEKFGKFPPMPHTRFADFHSSIQKFERRWGLTVDIAWFVVIGSIVVGKI